MTTAKLSLPEIAHYQASKEVTHNEALWMLDFFGAKAIKDRDLSTPPANPSTGDAYLIKATGTGEWENHDGEIAHYWGEAWQFYEVFEGLTIWLEDENLYISYDGSTWHEQAFGVDNVTLEISSGLLQVKNGGIGSDQLADDAVTDSKVAAGINAAKIGSGNVSNTEFDYLDGVTSGIQTQIDGKYPVAGGALTGFIYRDVDDSFLILSGGSSVSSGANIVLYGSSHATSADGFRFRQDTDNILSINSSGQVGYLTTNPQTNFHLLITGDPGTPSPLSHHKEVIQNTGNSGAWCFLGLYAPTNGVTGIDFGDTDDPNIGSIRYRHDNERMELWTNDTCQVIIDSSGNIGLDTLSFGTNAAKVLGLAAGTAPTTAPSNMAQMWVEDIAGTAGKAGLHMMAESGTEKLIIAGIIRKTTTGNPSQVHEGLMCINTQDNNIKMYADGGWRTLATW